jgi:(p)ppGpp synthase/HD superfamily hydrolase
MFSQDLYERALHFAATAHGEQQTEHGHPYVVHTTSVAMELIAAFRVEPDRDEDLGIACALLHDVVEDTETTVEQISGKFGQKVASGVLALTKNIDLNKDQQLADSLARIRREPVEIAMVKLADRISNLGPPPPDWTSEQISKYRKDAEQILETLGGASPALAKRFRARLKAYPS